MALVLAAGPAGNPAAQAESPATPAATSAAASAPFYLSAPGRATAFRWGNEKRVYVDLGLRLVAQNEPFELWSQRKTYDDRIVTEWRRKSGTVKLPTGTMWNFRGVPNFIKVTVRNQAGKIVHSKAHTVCLNGDGERVNPDADARSPYPMGCPSNPYTTGSVQGLQKGWATRLDLPSQMKLANGKYRVTVAVDAKYRKLFGVPQSVGSRSFPLVIKKGTGEGELRGADNRSDGAIARPAAQEPSSARGGRIDGPLPDLRSLPAFGIQVNEGGNYLRFSANVWNAGNSPLVVDGFRKRGEDHMDGYQYFFDSDGEQTGYEKVGKFHWHAAPTHNHWHFLDFARYRLLKADKTNAVRSRKESFCLANTDAVDYTVPGADWRPENTDLHTSCGEKDSLSIREVLSAGSGDTYQQFRAGQSFNLKGLPNGVYYIAVEANPMGTLHESNKNNNVRLRRIWIGGKPGARTVHIPQVGIIKEHGTAEPHPH
ncbi:lysyl oxidase family protein [Nocardioides speluncae]|uniref:lysyl oxidase family protein n=1 Tax=Nocardioides speluncae TaxID=2670337 RepID=UPI00137B30B5|nr:lysyl oxidase family protein [Nocardioides speluncae]